MNLRQVVAAVLLLVAGCAERRSSGVFEHGAVAADHATASEAGAAMLRLGGNAVDAAVATSFTLSVVRPESCGIGGGGFMVIHLANGTNVALNYREMAPAAVGPDYYEKLDDPHASTHGGMAVGIPGTVAGLLYALEKYGTRDRATVLGPAIRAAERGFIADEHYASSVREASRDFEKNPEFKTRFAFVWKWYLHEGRVEKGDRIKIPGQADALRLIAERGAAGFYDGPVAEAIAETVRGDGGALTRADLGTFKVAEVEPLRFAFMERQFLTMPPPSSGGVAMAEALGVFERIRPDTEAMAAEFDRIPFYSKEAMERGGPAEKGAIMDNRSVLMWELSYFSGPYLHSLTESLKHAFADRSRWLGDPAFVAVPTQKLLSADYQASLAARFDRDRTLAPEQYGSNTPAAERRATQEDHGTSHFCVVDHWGNAVACTETVNLGFGSCLAVEKFGFILNDQLDDFTTHRGKANAFGLKQSDLNLPAPGKRPLSSMTPTIVLGTEGRVELVAGASGGPRIITGTMQAILNVLVFGASAENAVRWPRIHHQWSPNSLRLEEQLFDGAYTATGESSLRSRLESLGHKVERIDSVGNVQVIVRTPEGWDAACDPRKGGRAAGH